jgi:5-methylcytosine-specific restriction endonuclease McrA
MVYNHSYKARAEKAGLEFKLNKDQFRIITQKLCHYCGSPPLAVSYRGARGAFVSGNSVSQYVYNGLDRKDSQKGYTIKNVVPCCGVCNHAKHTMPYKDFLAWLDRIVLFRRKDD